MIYESVAEMLDAIDETHARLSARLEALSEAQQNFRPSDEAWSIAQIAEHLSAVEGQIAKLIQMMLTKAEAAGAPSLAGRRIRPVTLDAFVERSRGEKYVAPENARPVKNLAVPVTLARMRETRAGLRALLPRLEATDLSGVRYPHPAFGPFDPYQWLLFITMHEERHLRQIEAIIARPEFPALD